MGREPSLEDVRTCWNRAARLWDKFARTGLDYHSDHVHGPAMLPNVRKCGAYGL